MRLSLSKFSLAILCLSSFFVYATKIELTKKNKPGFEDKNGVAANAVFLNFLSCKKEDQKINSEQLIACAKNFFVPNLNHDQLLGYAKFLVFPTHYSDLFYCDPEKTNIVKTFEEKGYDLFLCVDSNIRAPKYKTGVIFFQKVNGNLKIRHIKL